MKLYPIRDSGGKFIGISIYSGCHADEDSFTGNLPANHAKGEVRISILSDEISITSGLDGTRSFKITPDQISPDELSLLKDGIENDRIRTEIKNPGSVSLFAHIIFMDEPEREAMIME